MQTAAEAHQVVRQESPDRHQDEVDQPERSADEWFDFVIIGGGIVGLSTALAISERWPGKSVAVVEKEPEVATHQTGHNSGVVHSGIYYAPGSLKARLTRRGVDLLKRFCADFSISYVECGKVVVATDDNEVGRLEALFERGTRNGVPGIRLIDAAELKEIEPHARGVKAIHSPETAIVDYVQVCQRIAEVLIRRGARILLGKRVTGIQTTNGSTEVSGPGFAIGAGFLINCAGLYSDRVVSMTGATPPVRIVPFRGEYYLLKPERRGLVRGLIYPVPDPGLPFLGVHFTSTVHGDVEAGPNAVLALSREGYRAMEINVGELVETLTYGGFLRLAMAHCSVGLFEVYRSLSKAAFVRSLKKLVPAITSVDIARGPAGVRAQAVDASGRLVDDFVFHESDRSLHVLNAPSPAATAGMAIGEYIADRLAKRY